MIQVMGCLTVKFNTDIPDVFQIQDVQSFGSDYEFDLWGLEPEVWTHCYLKYEFVKGHEKYTLLKQNKGSPGEYLPVNCTVISMNYTTTIFVR